MIGNRKYMHWNFYRLCTLYRNFKYRNLGVIKEYDVEDKINVYKINQCSEKYFHNNKKLATCYQFDVTNIKSYKNRLQDWSTERLHDLWTTNVLHHLVLYLRQLSTPPFPSCTYHDPGRSSMPSSCVSWAAASQQMTPWYALALVSDVQPGTGGGK